MGGHNILIFNIVEKFYYREDLSVMSALTTKRRTNTASNLVKSRKDNKLFIRVSDEEKSLLMDMAASKGVTLSNFIMNTLFSSLTDSKLGG